MTACSACSLKHVLVREVKLALLQHYVSISSLFPAMDCLEQGWEVSARCGVVHMHLHPIACVLAMDNPLRTITSSRRADGKWKPNESKKKPITNYRPHSHVERPLCGEQKRGKKGSYVTAENSNWMWRKERETSLLFPQMPQRQCKGWGTGCSLYLFCLAGHLHCTRTPQGKNL